MLPGSIWGEDNPDIQHRQCNSRATSVQICAEVCKSGSSKMSEYSTALRSWKRPRRRFNTKTQVQKANLGHPAPGKACSDDRQGLALVRGGCVSTFGNELHATAALAIDRPAQENRIRRNPERNACATASRRAALALASRFFGRSMPASSISLERISRTVSELRGRLARLRFRWVLKTFTITIPSTAMARTPANRATALLIPDAVPAWSLSTEAITTVVSGATVTAIPKPSTTDARKNVFQ